MRTRRDGEAIERIRDRRDFFFSMLAVVLLASLGSFSFQDARPSSPDVLTADDTSAQSNSVESKERSQIMERLGVLRWHAGGWRGRGVKVAVLDSGFHGYREHLGKALPRTVAVRSFRFDGNLEAKDSQHGILCAEVIHALAPEAELLLANWEPEHPQQFLAAVRWARQEGARILSCSIIMPTWSDYEGRGRIHDELTRLLSAKEGDTGALFFASAGNTAQRHWSGSFEDGVEGYHVWNREDGVAVTDNVVRPWGRERISVELCCSLCDGYELTVSDASTRKVVSRATSRDLGGANCAVAAFVPDADHEYGVRVRALGKAKGKFHLVVLGGSLRYARSAGSIPFPGDGAEVVAVGAVDAAGRRMAYSSCGTPLAPSSLGEGDVERGVSSKPDFVAAVPFPSGWRSRPFAGTSAAAPQGSALAALLWSRHTEWNAEQIRATLKGAARPCSAKQACWETGRGLMRMPAPFPVP
jgi:subtilisin family serine protease